MIRGRFLRALLLAGLVAVGIGALAVAPAMRNQSMYGTVSTKGTPPLIRYCGRTYLPAPAAKSGRPMEMLNSAEPIGTTPSGMPVIATLLSSASRAYLHTQVCTTAVWVHTRPPEYPAHPF